jgi:hypothetical protein
VVVDLVDGGLQHLPRFVWRKGEGGRSKRNEKGAAPLLFSPLATLASLTTVRRVHGDGVLEGFDFELGRGR